MTLKPIVRHMLLCDDWHVDPLNGRRVTIVGLVSAIRAIDDPPFPIVCREMCVFLALTAGRGRGEGKNARVFAADGQLVFETRSRPISFGPDPLEIVAAPFRIRNMTFNRPGMHSVQFWYDGEMVEERPLRLR